VILTLTWSFVASSLLFCQALLGLYEVDGVMAVKTVFGLALLSSLAFALPLSVFVATRLPGVISSKLSRELAEPDSSALGMLERRAHELSLPAVKLVQSPSRLPFAYSVGRTSSIIVISEGLVEQFDPDEMESVLTHELAHVKNNDTELNTIVALYRKVLFFDPLMHMVEGALHREREFLADELSARETRKPLSLASALIKIHSAYSEARPTDAPGLTSIGRASFSRVPILRQRVHRLLQIAQELEGPSRAASELPLTLASTV
jgi:Zn-dependent protease with chaperone function